MVLKRHARFPKRNAASIVGYAKIRYAAVFDFNGDSARTGVYGVFHKLLDNGARTFDHFSGGDFADRVCVQYFDCHQILRASSESL